VSRHRRKRRRARTTAPAVPPRPPRRPETQLEERPKTPWHPFPLVELAIFVGLVCLVVGFITRDRARGRVLLALGLTLGALGGLDTAVREHFAGFRSHALVLAAFPTVATAVILALAGVPPFVVPAAAVLVFAAVFVALRRAWDRTARRSPA
jgi:hypothetical protein